MGRQYFVSGESMVLVKGPSNSPLISSVTQLGLSDQQISIVLMNRHKDIVVNAYGEVPPETQFMLAEGRVQMSLVNFDPAVVEELVRLSMGGAPAFGQMPHAGTLMGGNVALGAPGSNYVRLNISSPIGQLPWRFYAAYLAQQPMVWPLGTEKSLVQLDFRCLPVPPLDDPWNGGLGAYGTVLCDNTLDS